MFDTRARILQTPSAIPLEPKLHIRQYISQHIASVAAEVTLSVKKQKVGSSTYVLVLFQQRQEPVGKVCACGGRQVCHRRLVFVLRRCQQASKDAKICRQPQLANRLGHAVKSTSAIDDMIQPQHPW